MNKRKTLRMTSILLALMMFFGMVSVLLVPAGVAGAASGSGNVELVLGEDDDDEALDAKYALDSAVTNSVRVKISKLLWDDTKAFDSIVMQIIGPDEKAAVIPPSTTKTEVELTKSTTEDGIYYYDLDLPVAYNSMTGLYSVRLFRVDGKWRDEGFEVGLFWYYNNAGTLLAAATNQYIKKETNSVDDGYFVGTAATVPGYASLGAVIPFGVMPKAATKRIMMFSGLGDRFVDETKTFAGGSVDITDYSYTIPTTAKHGDEYEFTVIATNGTDRAPGQCEGYVLCPNKVPANDPRIIVDSKGPVIGDIVLSNNSYIDRLWDNFVVRSHADRGYPTTSAADERNFVEVSSIKDADSGVGTLTNGTATKSYVLFENPLNSKVKVGSALDSPLTYYTTATTWITNDSYFGADKKAANALLFDLGSPGATTTDGFYNVNLLNKRFKVSIVATDQVGNEATKSYGTVDFLDDYEQIYTIRVEQQNVLEMYVGQTINYNDVLFNGVKIITNEDTSVTTLPAATFPENYIWFANNDIATLNLFDFDYDAQTITAKAAGEGNIYVAPWVNYKGESAFPFASVNGYMKVIVHAQPTVSSITLSSSNLQLAVGAEHKLTATTVPTGVTATWTSGNTSIATVDQNGNVKAIAAGSTTVSVAAGGKYAVCTVVVTDTTIVDPDPPYVKTEGWKDEGNNRYYYVDDQKVVGWRKIDGSWYFFDYTSAAMRANGWLKEGGKWYYLNSNGTMKSAEWFKDNNGKWYWLKANGAMAAGWEKINGTWYYFNASGAMQTGWVNVRGIWYYMKSSGAMAEGWLQDGGSWYYLTPGGGAMVTGRVTINGRASNFATSGRWLGYV